MRLNYFFRTGAAGIFAAASIVAFGAPDPSDEQLQQSVNVPDFIGHPSLFGTVYLMTNQVQNAVKVFVRIPNGNLITFGTFPTGGQGDPVAQPGDPPTDALASQNSLILSEHDRFLFAVNAGSNEISAFRVDPLRLVLVDRVSSGGVRPISLAVNSDRLYVLNEGGTPNITGFRFDQHGELSPIANSTRPLTGGAAADPAEVSFSPSGDVLVVTEKDSNIIDTYTVGLDGVPSDPIANNSNGMTPFGFAFDRQDNLIVSEAFGAMPGQAAVSSYGLTETAMLKTISGSVPDQQTAACWIAISQYGRYAYTTNTASGVVSSYRIDCDGSLTLLNSVAADTGTGSAPIDMALKGRYLYVLASGSHAIKVFHVGNDGSLSPAGTKGGLPAGAQGIAAR